MKQKIELVTEGLVKHLKEAIENSSTVYILVSFVMKSGVEVLKESLHKAAERGADIKICTGDYMYVTQPEALKMLSEIHPSIEIRLFKCDGTSFHPKAYLFRVKETEQFIIGSSNLSRSALTSGIEWNVSIYQEKELFDKAINQFMHLMYHDQTVPINDVTIKAYEKEYDSFHKKHPQFIRKWTEKEELDLMLPQKEKQDEKEELIKEPKQPYGEIKPRFAQVEALEALQNTLEEGYDRALVVMATGLGKTYLAGFFAEKFDRILFIAHREEILHQAKKSFQHIIQNKTFGIYDGKQKNRDADYIFASIFTLSMKQHLEVFHPDEFDLIVIDEFHHAAAKSYQRVLDYFNPSFLLGITATPDRNDHKDVYAICDGNVAYRIDFLEAIQRQWLSPFQYYGVYDDTDYSQITWLGNRYDEEELLQAQLRDELAERILQAWEKYKQTRTIVFCSSIRQADYLSTYFNESGYKTISLHSKQTEMGRKEAIEMLSNGELDAIFTVDLFNEGVDIPSVDTLLFVRPTESLTIFTQQIGRGLRLQPNKDYCVIIDLIGNYRNADVKLSLFDTKRDQKKQKRKVEPVVPTKCTIQLDTKVIHLLEEMTKKKQPRKEKLLHDYFDLKNELGRRPTYLELHLNGKSFSIEYRQEFKSYFGFLFRAKELTEKEETVYNRYKDWFEEVEKNRNG